MKKIFTIIAAITLFISCDESKETVDSLSFPSDAFITFAKVTDGVAENTTDPITIEVVYANSSSETADVSIDFTVSSDNGVAGTDFTVVNGKSSFSFSPAAGKYTDNVQIMPVDNGVLGTENIVITLTLGNSTYTTGYPGPNNLGKSTTITIMDDDCAREEALGIYAGTYLGTDSCGDFTGVEVEIALPCGTGITIRNVGYAWLTSPYWSETIVAEYDVKINIDAAAGTVDIPEQKYVRTDYLGNEADYTLVGSGTIDTSGPKPVISISYDMNSVNGSSALDYAGSSCAGLFEATFTLQ